MRTTASRRQAKTTNTQSVDEDDDADRVGNPTDRVELPADRVHAARPRKFHGLLYTLCFFFISCPRSVASTEVGKDGKLQASQTNEKCSQGKFLNVAELSSAADRSSGSAAAIDMGKALKGLAAFEPQASSGLAADSSEKCDLSSNFTGNFMSECQVPGQKAPLDLTLKTSIRVVSSSSVNWIHRSAVCGTMPFFQHCFSTNQNMTGSQGFKGLHSWMYPQSVLPPSLISALSSPTADGVMQYHFCCCFSSEFSFQCPFF
ncbi:uncharacterized protein DS421_16g530330 [Arachis hypogaea]|nr:uncharacterized protein DS421_16g530330 [Arachis hypogaea]